GGCACGSLASHTDPFPSLPPAPHPCGTTCELYMSAGIQKTGTLKPPAGTIESCRQSSSAGPVSIVVMTPGGKGNFGSVLTASTPGPVLVTISTAAQPFGHACAAPSGTGARVVGVGHLSGTVVV